MIIAVEGKPGQGKSVYLVNLADKYLRGNYFVFSNINITPPQSKTANFQYFEQLEELLLVRIVDILEKNPDIKGIKIILDEMQVYLSSRNWDKLDIKFQLLLQQHRKRGIDIIGATQSIKRADVVFRELIQVFYRINKIVTYRFWGKKAFGFFYLIEYDPDSIESQSRKYERIGWPFLFFADPVIMAMYDTMQEVKLAENKGRIEVRTYVYEEKTTVEPKLVSKAFQS